MRSNLTVTVTAASRMLATRANVKAVLEIATATTTYDARIDRLIRAASVWVSEHLEREPWLQTYLEKLPGSGGRYLRLSRWPLKAKPASVTEGTGSSPSTVTAADYSVAGPWRDRLYMATGWSRSDRDTPRLIPLSGDRPLDYNVTYTAGWIMPDEITAWSSGGSIAANGWYSSAADPDHPLIFQAGGAGTFDTTEPTWPTVHEGTVADTGTGTVTFTAYGQRLPEALEEAAIMLVADWFGGGLAAPAGIAEESFEGARIRYAPTTSATSRAVESIIGAYA